MLRKRNKTPYLALLLCFFAVDLSAKNLTKQELGAFMGIITQFIMSDVPDKKAPVFTTASSVTVAENQNYAYRVRVSDASPVHFSLIGGDSNAFNINASTGAITFKNTPDFETRNTYSFTVKATDSSGNSNTQSVTIHIRDLPEIGKPKKTGQIPSYRAGDDGDLRRGIAHNYTRNNEIVTDHVTGFLWQDDIRAKTTKKTYSEAVTYCRDLVLHGVTGWRLPTIQELNTIIMRGKYNPAMDTTVFVNYANNDAYRSSTLRVSDTSYTWGISDKTGMIEYHYNNAKGYVRCIK